MTDNQKIVAEKLIETHKVGKRFRFVYKEVLQNFLMEYYGIKTKTKNEAIDRAYELLNPDTLVFFAENIENFGISQGDVKNCLEISDRMMKKLINENKLRIMGTYYNSGYNYNIINIIDVLNCADTIKKRERVIQAVPCTKDNLSEALYIINKSAKKSRDTKQRAFFDRDHGICHQAKTRSLNLYHLKDAALKKMRQDGYAEYMGIHRQVLEDREPVFLDLYEVGRFTFHCPHHGEINEEDIRSEVIDGEISAEQTKRVSIKFSQAVNLLESYCGVSATGTYNRYSFGYC